jgi:hypothetical protein
MATRQEQFFAEVYAGARQAGLSDAQARLAAAQSSLETGFGKSMPGGNMFGIKAGKSWTGPTQNLNTWEDVGGRVNIVDKFRAYENPFDSLGDWAGLLDRRFPEASAASSFTDAVGGLRAGQPGGYATDRQYGNKLTSIDGRFGEAAQQNYGLMGRDIPTPSMAPRGVMDVLGSSPAEVAAYTDGGLRNASFPATPTSVERGLLADVNFDSGRFGDPAPAQTAQFDQGRFGPTNPNVSYGQMVAQSRATRPQPVQAAQFDSGRFGTATTQPQGVSGLRDGLLASNAQMAQPQGILNTAAAAQPSLQMAKAPASFQGPVAPGMQPAMDAANLSLDVADLRAAKGLPAAPQPSIQAAPKPGYVDPAVSVQPASPAQPARAVQPSQPAPAGGGLLSADGPMSGGFGPGLTREEADRMSRNLSMRTMGGGLLGGLLGGALLGPVGALAGGYLGRNMGAKSYYPTAPQPSGNGQGKGYGRDSLSSEGRDAAGRSKQFDKAVSSGKGGLW